MPRSKIKHIISKTYAVLLGSLDKNKNLQIILQSIPRGLDFVLIGDLMKTKLDGLRGRLFYFAKLKDFYSESIIKSSGFLLFSSLYEGYGMPPIEAILLKVNSISSNRPSMREILGGRSILLNANSITE
ncbi:glycosyltransferase [Candidatus Pinguicoccus supinus]|uniref:Glycosyltransferase n=1 Tax=Candidatus Pinguicoccus supinus TaxID=2529394 RepID=A0A7T0FXT1_9BACT|nr:glycosyltransferase [Candidatus Pinguicoccus supinus]